MFPQIAGLGQSQMSRHFAIDSSEEARANLLHPVLGERLRVITELANQHAPTSARAIFAADNVKFHSSVTLFSRAAPADPVLRAALNPFLDGVPDGHTETIQARHAWRRPPSSSEPTRVPTTRHVAPSRPWV